MHLPTFAIINPADCHRSMAKSVTNQTTLKRLLLIYVYCPPTSWLFGNTITHQA